MSRNAVTARAETPFEKIWELIFEKRVSGIPIVGKLNLLMGIISEEDLIEKLYPSYADYLFDPQSRDFEKMEDKIADVSGIKAKHLMSKNVYTTTEEAPIMKAASSMLVYKVSCLPVVKEKGRNKYVVGIICKGDIFSQLFTKKLGKKMRRKAS
jgi:CBS domain-containing protein